MNVYLATSALIGCLIPLIHSCGLIATAVYLPKDQPRFQHNGSRPAVTIVTSRFCTRTADSTSALRLRKQPVDKLVTTQKVPKYAYNVMLDKCIPERSYVYWNSNINVPKDIDWEKIHKENFNCMIDTRLRSFFFKVFHKAIAFNAFLYKIKRKDSPNCAFCEKLPKTVHIFCDCEIVSPVWQDLVDILQSKHNKKIQTVHLQ